MASEVSSKAALIFISVVVIVVLGVRYADTVESKDCFSCINLSWLARNSHRI